MALIVMEEVRSDDESVGFKRRLFEIELIDNPA